MPGKKWRVICGNGHRPFARFFDSHSEAEQSAYFHNMFVHAEIQLGLGLAEVGEVFVNLP